MNKKKKRKCKHNTCITIPIGSFTFRFSYKIVSNINVMSTSRFSGVNCVFRTYFVSLLIFVFPVQALIYILFHTLFFTLTHTHTHTNKKETILIYTNDIMWKKNHPAPADFSITCNSSVCFIFVCHFNINIWMKSHDRSHSGIFFKIITGIS